MKSKLTLITLALLLSSCMEAEYNKLAWESKMQDKRLEIIKKQITIDSLKSFHEKSIDTFIFRTVEIIDTIRMPYLMRDTVFINDTILRVEIQRYTPFKN